MGRRRVIERLGLDPPPSQLVDRRVVGNRQQPAREPALRVVAVEPLERLDEGVLGQLLGTRRVANHPGHQGEDRPLETADQLLKCALGTVESPANQVGVCGSHMAGRLAEATRLRGQGPILADPLDERHY